MKIGICVGNPPYQKETSNTTRTDIWPDFLRLACNMADKVSTIQPARWVQPKKSMKNVQMDIVRNGLRYFDFYNDFNDIFIGDSARIAGGVTIANFEKGYNGVIFYNGDRKYNPSSVFTKNSYEDELLKIFDLSKFNNKNIVNRIVGTIGAIGGNIFGTEKVKYISWLKDSKNNINDPIRVWASKKLSKAAAYHQYWAEKSKFKSIPQNILSTRKLMISKTNGCSFCQIMEKNDIGASILYIIPEKDTDRDLSLLKSFFRTKTINALTRIIQGSDIYTRGFEIVPDYVELAKKLPADINEFTDQWFYKEFNFSKELQDYVENNIYIHPDNYGCK